jgi:hypothetical protein
VVSVAVVTGICTITMLGAQQRGAEQAPATPRETATDELVGYWVSVISEDWRWRMVTPAKGDVTSIPLTPAGLALASQWDPARDAAMGEACKSYGAPGLMRAPTRLSITWADDQTLRVDTDYGEQTRLLHFGEIEVTAEPSLQGHSVAEWESLTPSRDGGRPAGHLRVDTSHLTSGYLRKNGVPYSADTLLTEYWDVFDAPNADRWLVITSVVHDPENLQLDWITSLNFKQEPNGANWNPTPCSTEW